jgi:hypothetical protein
LHFSRKLSRKFPLFSFRNFRENENTFSRKCENENFNPSGHLHRHLYICTVSVQYAHSQSCVCNLNRCMWGYLWLGHCHMNVSYNVSIVNCLTYVMKIQENIHERANLQFCIPVFFYFILVSDSRTFTNIELSKRLRIF